MTVLVIQRLIGKEELCHLTVELPFDLEMDMGRSHVASRRGVGSRLDRRESVSTLVVGPQQCVALEARIQG